MKILVIEDEPASLKLANVVLSSEGHHVTDVRSAEQAIAAVAENCPEVVLVDLSLPGMDGLAFIRGLKQHAKTRDIPVIAVTAYPDRFPREQAFAAGCDGYIVKPIDTRKLAGQVAAILKPTNPNS